MNEVSFSGVVQVQVSGDPALQLVAYDRQRLTYQVEGFFQPAITIYDHRRTAAYHLDDLFSEHLKPDWSPHFDLPAFATVERAPGEIRIHLEDTDESKPPNVLYISVGQPGEIEIHDFFDYEITQYTRHSTCFYAIYPQPADKPAEFFIHLTVLI